MLLKIYSKTMTRVSGVKKCDKIRRSHWGVSHGMILGVFGCGKHRSTR